MQTRSQERRVTKSEEEAYNWDMAADFTMRIQRTGDRVVISREGFSGWKAPTRWWGIRNHGTVRFVKEILCQGRNDRRCVQFRAETGADQKQVKRLLESFIRRAGAGQPKIVFFDQRFKTDIVVDKKTMLPQQLTITRLHTFELEKKGQNPALTEEITKTYTFAWTMPEN